MMNEQSDILQIIGSLMKKPSLLSQTDKYSLSISDFPTRFFRYIFDAIQGLYSSGVAQVQPIDVENYLSVNNSAISHYNDNNGREFLNDAIELSDERNFDYYYNRLKKFNALKKLKKNGFSIDEFYQEDLLDEKAKEVNAKFEELKVDDIFSSIHRKIIGIEQEFLSGEISKTQSVFDGIADILDDIQEGGDIGLPLQGQLTTLVMSGARKGTFMLRSAASSVGKSRSMVADACFLAFPVRFNSLTCTWEQKGSCEKVLYITTEQSIKEIQRMVLAYLTDINESKFRYGNFSDLEKKVVAQALKVLEEYKENLYITQMPDPSNELIKTTIQNQCTLYGIEYVFFDYIFISTALLKEFKGTQLRNDEILLLLSTTLKNLAVELNVFVMSATQVNANADNNKDIRNEASLAGGRATINKADYGFIMARPTNEELSAIEQFTTKYGKIPNIVTDVYKVRSGEWTQVRIWSYFNLGTLKKEDLFMTDSMLRAVDISRAVGFQYENWESETLLNECERLNEELANG